MALAETLILFATIMLGFTISGLIGFGGNVLAMPILSMIFNVKEIVLAFAAISFTNSLIRCIQYRKNIIIRKFMYLASIMLMGSIAGLLLYHNLPENILKLILGCFIIIMAIYNFIKKDGILLKENEKDRNIMTMVFYHVLLLFGGIMQGAFVCGGPLLVIFCNHYFGYNRKVFLGMQWGLVFLNAVILMTTNTMADSYHGTVLIMSFVGIVALIGAFWISGRIANKISDKGLRGFINIILLVSGFSTLIQTIMKLI